MSHRTLERKPEAGAVTVDPRIQARRDEVSRERQRHWRRWLIGVAAVAVTLGLAWFVTHGPLLDVDQIRAAATAHLTEDQIIEASGLRPGQNLIDVDPGAVRNRLLAVPWVDDATVDLDWTGGTVRVSVTERTPVAAVSDGAGGWILADATGRAVSTLPAGVDVGVIIVDGVAPVAPGEQFGPALDGPLQVIAALTPGVRTRIISVVPAADGTIDLHAHPAVTVQLCRPDQLAEKVRAMQTMFAQVDDAGMKTMKVCDPSDPLVTR